MQHYHLDSNFSVAACNIHRISKTLVGLIFSIPVQRTLHFILRLSHIELRSHTKYDSDPVVSNRAVMHLVANFNSA